MVYPSPSLLPLTIHLLYSPPPSAFNHYYFITALRKVPRFFAVVLFGCNATHLSSSSQQLLCPSPCLSSLCVAGPFLLMQTDWRRGGLEPTRTTANSVSLFQQIPLNDPFLTITIAFSTHLPCSPYLCMTTVATPRRGRIIRKQRSWPLRRICLHSPPPPPFPSVAINMQASIAAAQRKERTRGGKVGEQSDCVSRRVVFV
jgi:hypothetical protein